ncbi:MAG: hypothetical protein H7248_10430 [Microbacteriaceae bacterium]|nr:hypothetical protein [Microbacteriaceae bacterium]
MLRYPFRPVTARKTVVVTAVIAVTAVMISGIAAWAYFSRFAGNSTGTTASLVGLQLTAGTVTSTLSPGTSTAVTLQLVNPNPVALKFSSIRLDTSQGTSGYAIDAVHVAAGCTVAAAALTTITATTGWVIAANASTTITLPAGTLTMGLTAPNGCQGANISLFLGT